MFYFIGEAELSIKRRIRAMRKHLGLDDDQLVHVVPVPPTTMLDRDVVKPWVKDARAYCKHHDIEPAMVVFDTQRTNLGAGKDDKEKGEQRRHADEDAAEPDLGRGEARRADGRRAPPEQGWQRRRGRRRWCSACQRGRHRALRRADAFGQRPFINEIPAETTDVPGLLDLRSRAAASA